VTKDVEPLQESDLPHLWYNEHGESLHVITHIDHVKKRCRGRWINHMLTLVVTMEDDEEKMVGFEISGFKDASDRKLEWVEQYLTKHEVPVSSELSAAISNERKRIGA